MNKSYRKYAPKATPFYSWYIAHNSHCMQKIRYSKEDYQKALKS